MRWKYGKLLNNLGNAVDALCGPDPEARPLQRRAWEEGAACLAAAGIDAVTPEEDAARRGDRFQWGGDAARSRPGASSWQSLARGTGSIEADYLNGEIVLLGRLHGVPTPVNLLLQQTRGPGRPRGPAPPGACRRRTDPDGRRGRRVPDQPGGGPEGDGDMDEVATMHRVLEMTGQVVDQIEPAQLDNPTPVHRVDGARRAQPRHRRREMFGALRARRRGAPTRSSARS